MQRYSMVEATTYSSPTYDQMYAMRRQENSCINYSDGKRTVTADINTNMVAGVAVGALAGAALGIYFYKKFCEK